ncbi:iron ABC transporter permease [uncultured Sphaerochaeta sp.]|uniref:ABC transporter permease n=1 Tax=uncultured Sphaerochaeta sp. TaxID=886478 RepID=UPI002A0A14FD|nr:iron ABC transporter permease [uncultured Sphaerochaeta sp.]
MKKFKFSNTTRMNDVRKMLGEPFLMLAILVVFYLLILFVIFPIFKVFKTSLSYDGRFSLKNYTDVLKQSYYIQPLINSMILGILTATIGTFIGFTFAYAITRTPMKGKGIFRTIATFPMVSPPFVVALACILLFGRSGFFAGAIGNIYGLTGLTIVEVIAYTPTAFLALVGVLHAIDPSLEEAAMDCGASRIKIFKTIIFPLATPGIVSAWLLVFIQSLADFGNPMILSGNFSVLSVQAYLQITGMYDLARGSTLAILLLVPTFVAFYLQKYLLSKKSYVTVTGKPTSATIKNLEWYIKLPVYTICVIFAFMVVLFYSMVVWGSFQKLWGVDSTLTFNNYINMWKVGKGYIMDSLIISVIVTPITGVLSMFIAYLITRKRFIGRNFIEFSSMLTFAVPGTVVGIGYILAFNTPSLLLPVTLTGTGFIIITLLIFRNLPVGIRNGIAAIQQIDPSIEEASIDLGADSSLTFRKITLPMITPAFFSGLANSFVRSMTAISAIIFVVSGRWNLITVAVLGFVDNSQYAQAAAMSLLLITIVLIALGAIKLVTDKMGQGMNSSQIIE